MRKSVVAFAVCCTLVLSIMGIAGCHRPSVRDYFLKGIEYKTKKQFDKAIDCYTQAIN